MAVPVGALYGVGQSRLRRGLTKEANAPALLAGIGALAGLGGMYRHQHLERAGEQFLSDMQHMTPELRKERRIRRIAEMVAAASGGAVLGTGGGYLLRHMGNNAVRLSGDAGEAFAGRAEAVVKRNVAENLVPLKDEVIEAIGTNSDNLQEVVKLYGPKMDQASKALQDTVDTVRAPFVAAGSTMDFAKAQVNREVKIPGNNRVSEWANNTRFQDIPLVGKYIPKLAEGEQAYRDLAVQFEAEKTASVLMDGEQAAAQILSRL